MARTSITIVLELDQALDEVVTSPIGSARLPGGVVRTFQSWLGLVEAVDSLARHSPADRKDQPGPSKETR